MHWNDPKKLDEEIKEQNMKIAHYIWIILLSMITSILINLLLLR